MVPPDTLTALSADFGKGSGERGRLVPDMSTVSSHATPPQREPPRNHAHQQRRNNANGTHPERLTLCPVGLSRRTVDAHAEHVYTELGLSPWDELIPWVAGRG